MGDLDVDGRIILKRYSEK